MNEIRPMTENEHPRRTWPTILLAVAAIVVVVAGYYAMTYAWAGTKAPEEVPAGESTPAPTSSPTEWSPECTDEDLEDGACYTWDDIRNQPVYSQGPSGPVQVYP